MRPILVSRASFAESPGFWASLFSFVKKAAEQVCLEEAALQHADCTAVKRYDAIRVDNSSLRFTNSEDPVADKSGDAGAGAEVRGRHKCLAANFTAGVHRRMNVDVPEAC